MRSLNLDQLRSLVAIADLGSFAAAAQALHLAAPTVSLQISELEARVGAQLLQRGRRGALPTSAGALLVQRARGLLREAEETLAELDRHAKGLAGRVRLAAQTGVAAHVLPPLLLPLAAQRPEIELALSVLGTHHTLAGLLAGTLDLGIVTLPIEPQPGLQCRPWRRDPMLACLPPLWQAPARITPAWLADRPMIVNDASTQMQRMTLAWFGAAGQVPRPGIELNYTEAMKSLVAAGYGAAILPIEAEAQDRHAMQLRPLSPPLWRELGLVHRPRELLAPSVWPVLDALLGAAQPKPHTAQAASRTKPTPRTVRT